MPRILQAAALLLLTSCGINVDFERMNNHVIACDGEGLAYEPETQILLPPDALEARIDHILSRIDEHCTKACWDNPGKTRRLLIHVHGGLNSANASLEAADMAIESMRLESNKDDCHYPLFVTWDSGLGRSYSEYLFNLRHGRHAPIWGPITSPIYLLSDIGTSLMNLPRQWMFQIGSDVAAGANTAFGWNLLPSWQNAATATNALRGNPDGQVKVAKGNYSRAGLDRTGRMASYVLTLPLTLCTSFLVGQGVGQGSWEGMLHSASNLFHKYDEFDLRNGPTSPDAVQHRLKSKASGTLAVLLRHLNEFLVKEEALKHKYEITLVGHSMGAIILNSALDELTKTGSMPEAALAIRNIVYMAPACSVGEAANAIVPFMHEHKKANFYLLTLHPNAENEELNLFDLPPRGSLLEWIDNFYVRAANPQDRRLGKWVNIMQSLHLFAPIADRMSVKAFGVRPGSKPQKHGEFNYCPFWKTDFWKTDGPMFF